MGTGAICFDDRLRTSLLRGRCFGGDKWVATTPAKPGLLSDLKGRECAI